MEKIDGTIELVQQDENTSFVEKALQTTGGKKSDAHANPAKPEKQTKDKDKTPRKSLLGLPSLTSPKSLKRKSAQKHLRKKLRRRT